MKRKIAAILAADIAGYSKLVSEDEEETLRRLASYRSVFDDFIAKASGRIFNTAGDAVLAEFPSAVEAVRCAIDIQESLRTRNLAFPPSRQMNFRMGITVGDVVERNGDLLGDGVNIAARLQELAEPGGICIARSVYEQVTNKLSVQFSDIGERQVKNIPTPIHAYLVASRLNKSAHTSSKIATSKAVAATLGAIALILGGAFYYLSRTPSPTSSSVTATHPVAVQESLTKSNTDKSPAVVPSKQDSTQASTERFQPAPLDFHEESVRSLAAKQKIPLPQTIRIVEASPAVTQNVSKYLGAWGGDERWGGGGRQMILVVANVDATGTATGVYSFGPPTPRTYNQDPAHYWIFTGTITDNDLKFKSPDGGWKFKFRILSNELMQGQAVSPRNTHPSISIERIK